MYILFYTTKPYELEVTYLQKKKKKKKTMFELIIILKWTSGSRSSRFKFSPNIWPWKGKGGEIDKKKKMLRYLLGSP